MGKTTNNHHRNSKGNYSWVKYIFFFGAILFIILIALLARFSGQRNRNSNALSLGQENDHHLPLVTTRKLMPLPLVKTDVVYAKEKKIPIKGVNLFQPKDWQIFVRYLNATSEEFYRALIAEEIHPDTDLNHVHNVDAYFTVANKKGIKKLIKVLQQDFNHTGFIPNKFLSHEFRSIINDGAEDNEEYGCLIYNSLNADRLLGFFGKMRNELNTTSGNVEERNKQEDAIACAERSIKTTKKTMAGISVLGALEKHYNFKKMSEDFAKIAGLVKHNQIR